MKHRLSHMRLSRLPFLPVSGATFFGAAVMLSAQATAAVAQTPAPYRASVPEVRQIVTFLFQPSRLDDALAIYTQKLLPIYSDLLPLKRFRAYREAESPEPLDLVIVSSYNGMAGMDSANVALRVPHKSGQSAFALYGALSAMTHTHHDQFVEVIASLSDSTAERSGLTVFEYLRAAPGARRGYLSLLQRDLRAFEKAQGLYLSSETGRMLVSDGWDFLRIHQMASLEQWQRYQQQTRVSPYAGQLDSMIVARKTLILRGDARLSLR
jgi:hypothetical protein